MDKRVKGCLVLLGIGVVLAVIMVMVCSGPSAPKSSTPDGVAIEVLGRPEGDEGSGVMSSGYDGSVLEVEYQHFPLGLRELEKEVGNALVPMFKKVFEFTTAEEVVVEVFGPFEDKYGNYTWKHVLTLGISRASFERINWDHMSGGEFYGACDTYWKLPGLHQ